MNDCIPETSIVEALNKGSHTDVFAILGPHPLNNKTCIRAFQPHADTAQLLIEGRARPVKMTKIENSGLFVAKIKSKPQQNYQIRYQRSGQQWQGYDPYGFKPVFSETDNYLLTRGERHKSYQLMGANYINHYGIEGVVFAVWAPNARRVSVVGNFNGWDGRIHVMRKHHASGIWEIFIPEMTEGEYYKYEIIDMSGNVLPLKSDPYAFYCEKSPGTSSVIWRKNKYDWQDKAWMDKRASAQSTNSPISIYEVHLGSWRRPADNPASYLSYRELAHQLTDHIKALGYTHLQLMPISEFPFDGSWGYQPIGLFAPSSRFGNPDEFKYMVNYLHQNCIGVIIDWVPAHFPTDQHGLAMFDGTHLYEHEDPRQGYHQDWNTCIYNYGRNEVCNFLVDSACFWLDEYHIDGIRVDAVASMLYLDYSRKHGEWIPNKYGGNQNLEAIRFIQRFNEIVYRDFPGIITIAEESTSWPGVTRMTSEYGLGFGYKWNMGWMHDTLSYMSKDSLYRKHHHNDMTFGTLYAFSENFVLPISHDEVVHGKGSLINKMSGDEWQKFANLRAYLAFMWTYPGKKLLFMGNEFAQRSEWNHDAGLDWHLLEQPLHKNLMQLVCDLNKLYVTTPALHEGDSTQSGFNWVDADNSEESVFIYQRNSNAGDRLLVVCNFTPVVRNQYRIGVEQSGHYKELLNTDSLYYGGSNVGNMSHIESTEHASHGRSSSIAITLPPLSTCVFKFEEKTASDSS